MADFFVGVHIPGSTPPPQVALKLRMPKQEVKAEQPHVEPSTGHKVAAALPVQPVVDTVITASPVDPATADTQVDADTQQANLTASADAEMPPAVETPAHEQGDVDMGPPAVETAPTQTEMSVDQSDVDMPLACAEMPPPSTTPVKPKPSDAVDSTQQEQTPVDPPKPSDAVDSTQEQAPVDPPKLCDAVGSTQVQAPVDPPKPSDASTQGQAPVDPPKPSDASTQGQAPVDPPKPSDASTQGQAPVDPPKPSDASTLCKQSARPTQTPDKAGVVARTTPQSTPIRSPALKKLRPHGHSPKALFN